jgi:hypothetical protein
MEFAKRAGGCLGLLGLAATFVLSDRYSAAAETMDITVPSGKSSNIWWQGRIDSTTCRTEDPVNGKIRVLREPVHGSTQTTIVSRPFRSVAGSHPCNGKPFDANGLVYTPAKGFKGSDSLVVERIVWAHYREYYSPVELRLTVK